MTDDKTIAESNNFIVLDKYTKESKIAETYQSEYDLEPERIDDLKSQGMNTSPISPRLRSCWPMCASSCKLSTMCNHPVAARHPSKGGE